MAGNKLNFTPPTAEQVEAYFNEIGVQPAKLEAQRFIAHHETRGWKLRGGIQMVSWKSACQTWKLSPYRQPQGQSHTQSQPRGNYAPTGQTVRKSNYVQASNEQGVPPPDYVRQQIEELAKTKRIDEQ